MHRSPAERHRASIERRANRAARKRAERAREAQRREDERARRWQQKQARWAADGLDDPERVHVTSDPACRFHDAQLVDAALRGVPCHVCLPA